MRAAQSGWILALATLAIPAAGQSTALGTTARLRLRLVGHEQLLCLIQVEDARSTVFARGPREPFASLTALRGTIAAATVTEGTLYAFMSDGSLYSLADRVWKPELNLPNRAEPIDVVGRAAELYVLFEPPPPSTEQAAAASQPALSAAQSSRTAPGLAIAHYDHLDWHTLAAAPADIATPGPRSLRPRLLPLRDDLALFWCTSETRELRSARLDLQTLDWTSALTISDAPDIVGFWAATVGRVPMLLVATSTAEAGEQLSAFRLTSATNGVAETWRPVALQLSAPPTGATVREYDAAVGFNQHIALLATLTSGERIVQFARPDAPAAEATVRVQDVLENRQPRGTAPDWIRTSTLVVLFGVLAALFLFRRGAMVASFDLPPGYLPALAMQRLLACLIDLVPPLAITALIMGVDWQSSARELFGWALGSDAQTKSLPAASTLRWWIIGTSVYCAYCLVLESFTRRTLGKMVFGTRVLTESGQPPTWRQILVRNLFRFIELQPPLWILGFLVVLSRNRQRVGDIFARTIVVRRLRVLPPPPANDA